MTLHQFAPLKKEPAYRQVAQAIEVDIIEGRLKPGDTLPTEEALAGMFGLNRGTVREGLRVLELTGLIERGAAKRLIVANPEAEDLARNASRALVFSGVTFAQVFEALAIIQPQAAGLAAQKAESEHVAAFKLCTDTLRAQNKTDTQATLKAAVQFFEILADSLSNPILQITLLSYTSLIRASLEVVIDATPIAHERIIKAQDEIRTAIEKGDTATASAWMARHIADLKRGYEVAGVNFDARVG